MNSKILITKPKRILHIGDIHCFRHKRHTEHLEVLNNLCQVIKDEKIDLVYIGGDVVDSKTRLSPIQIHVVTLYFKSISNLVPIILIPGNHDCDIKNNTQLDSLTPIIQNIESTHPIYYLKESGVYELYNIDWAVWSCIDNLNPFEMNSTYQKERTCVGCFHGPVQGASVESGWSGFNNAPNIEIFEQCDIVMLADIHKLQTFRNKEIAYCGSLLQVTIDEDTNRGGLIWDLKDDKYEASFIPVKNQYGFKTYEIKDLDMFEIKTISLPSDKFVCRLLYVGTQERYSSSMFFELKKKIKVYYPNNDIILQKRFAKTKQLSLSKQLSEEVALISTKVDFFKEFCKGLDKSVYTELLQLDKAYDKRIDSTDYQVGEYVIEQLEIENFLSYGCNNVINFNELTGLIGLFAPNTYGKTNMLHAMMFCLFNTSTKSNGSLLSLINDQMPSNTSAFVQMKLRINGNQWRIKRTITPNKKNASISVEVYEIVDREEVARHQESRPVTDNQVLRKLLGDEEMFLTLVFYDLKNQKEFVAGKNAARLDSIIKFLGITTYDDKLKLVTEDLKEQSIIYKQLFKAYEHLVSDEILKEEQITLNLDIIIKSKSLEKAKQEWQKKESIILKINNTIKALNILGVEKSEVELLTTITAVQLDLTNKQGAKIVKLAEAEELNDKQKEILDWVNEQEKVDEKTIGKTEQLSNEIKLELSGLKKQLENETCPTCSQAICIDKETIENNITKLEKNLEFCKGRLVFFKEIERQEFLWDKGNIKKEQITNQLEKLEIELHNCENKIMLAEQQLVVVRDNKVKISQRTQLYAEIKELEAEINSDRKIVSDNESSIRIMQNRESTIIKEISNYSEKKKEIAKLEGTIKSLTSYQELVHRNGIPSLILQTYIPTINQTLNNYLEDLFDFKLMFDYKDDKLDIAFHYSNGVQRDVVQASGMEGTIINLAIRAALNEISLLPKPSFLMLDEIFATLDDMNLEKIKEFLPRLKDCYQNILIISHLEDIKELPDHFISLEKKDGITYVSI